MITQVPLPLGAIAPSGPVTVAVNRKVAPRAALVSRAATVTVGEVLPTVVVAPEVGEDGK